MRLQRFGVGALCGALVFICSALSSEPSRSAPGLTETELKAVFLLRLPQFVAWPDGRAVTTFCVDEASDVAALLSEMVASDPRGRAVLPVEAGRVSECDVVFGALALNRESAKGPQLWVSDAPGFARDGGMVELKRRGARMGLVVNVDALSSVGLKANSKLLQLAEVVGSQ